MIQPKIVPDDSDSIESLFMQAVAKQQGCSLQPSSDQDLCPSYFKTLEVAADWHVVTAMFAIVLVFMFVGLAIGKRE
ncbi:MAG: hypothetical protein UX09_C0013G0015 [Candidatus Uhrbacteria bacterium GW2011_GWE2_45_35]|uniref:Uncharacterized protein n=2 Tax=Candidatus Uhriibacteriota TaxID=1752732 RepID=A0A0G1JKL9_9BACT|nr:MAG: hypothetical protein UW63_C0005G0013 [Candidatus Uhrbacteria bacterium GW2011_GWF2_44_350]KKU08772.1 MAG: hypothetical protein UX09_C0013G0015 [Candidatus Uhrbacteria bacterium GW2011_GWE2_45_35]HBR80316.1 hypothetical protein [Candidatus Uhrbacteria bacterium]HCU31838.1 hypothetical protein [Candidatus Uhrbacteria bacterium]